MKPYPPFFRGRRHVRGKLTRHRPVERSHGYDDVSRGAMKGVCVRIDSKTIGIAYAIEDRSTEGC